MHEEREVRCRCGERVYTTPSSSVRCPNCGRRLFWRCKCGALVERVTNHCPYCGATYNRSHAETHPRLRLRMILFSGLVGAIVFFLLGHWLLEKIPMFSATKVGAPNLQSSPQGSNIVSLTLKGVFLLFADLVRTTWQILSEHPALFVFAGVGFVIAASLTARRQQFSWRRLKRHLRRKWKQFTSR